MSKNGLASDLTGRTEDDVKVLCAVTRLLNTLEGEDKVALESAIKKIKEDQGLGRAKVYSSNWLSGVLRKNGYNISSSTVSRHMKGSCGCG